MACDTILAMDAVGIDVSIRSFKLAAQSVEPPARIRELERNSVDGVDIVITHTLPVYFAYHGGPKNVGMFHMETTSWKPSGWAFFMNLMDHLLVTCPENKKAAIESGVTKPIGVIPRGIDPSLHNKDGYKKLNLNLGGRYAFYHIGDYSTRKNTDNLIKAYFQAFTRADNVVLVLKTYFEGKSPQESMRMLQEKILEIKKSMRLWGTDHYPPIIAITDYWSSEDMMALHAMCDCFVTAETGSAWTLPNHTALAFGNWTISSKWVNDQYVKDGINGTLVGGKFESACGMTQCPFPNLYTAHEEWYVPDTKELSLAMKATYRDKPLVEKAVLSEFLNEYSYGVVGNKIKKELEAIL